MEHMNIGLIGINHKTASLDIRESLGFSVSEYKDALEKLKELYPFDECVVLSTCNRVEIYFGNLDNDFHSQDFINFLSAYHNKDTGSISPYVYTYKDEEALDHLFKVASGLDSLVVGENQILGQIKKSYQTALELGTTGKVLNLAFQKGFKVAKQVRAMTKIGEGNVSISSVSCQLAEEVLEGLEGKKVMLIGAGKIGAMALASLRDRGAETFLVSSRRYDKAKMLAEEFSGNAVHFEEIEDLMPQADILISSTSAPRCVIHADMIDRVMVKRANKPIFMIDLAVPRDIEPEIGEKENVFLYNIDSLKRISSENIKQRQDEISKCNEIITQEVKKFINRESSIRSVDIVLEENEISV